MTDAPAPALGFSVVSNLGGDRQMTVQYFVGRDDPLSAIHAMTDRVMAVVDRQKARYELKDMREEVISLEGKLSQFRADKERIQRDFAVKFAFLDVQMQEAAATIAANRDEAYAAHVATGRVAEFKLVGHAKSNAERFEAGRQQIMSEIEKQKAEQEQALHGVDTSIRQHEKALEAFAKQIAEREALLAGE